MPTSHHLDSESMHAIFRQAHDSLHSHLLHYLDIVEDKASHQWFERFLDSCLDFELSPQGYNDAQRHAFFVGLEYARHKLWRALHIHTDFGVQRPVCKHSLLDAFTPSKEMDYLEVSALSERVLARIKALA
jgi:hypothetical protein